MKECAAPIGPAHTTDSSSLSSQCQPAPNADPAPTAWVYMFHTPFRSAMLPRGTSDERGCSGGKGKYGGLDAMITISAGAQYPGAQISDVACRGDDGDDRGQGDIPEQREHGVHDIQTTTLMAGFLAYARVQEPFPNGLLKSTTSTQSSSTHMVHPFQIIQGPGAPLSKLIVPPY